jgi:hypothetical protein
LQGGRALNAGHALQSGHALRPGHAKPVRQFRPCRRRGGLRIRLLRLACAWRQAGLRRQIGS